MLLAFSQPSFVRRTWQVDEEFVSHTLRNPGGEWRASGPTMTTDELARFADWLESLASSDMSNAGCCFTERELEFVFDPDSNKLIVYIFHHLQPHWVGTDQTVIIEFSLDEVNLQAAINSIRQQLVAFPGRPPL